MTKSQRADLRAYCLNCTDTQLRNVHAAERERAKNNKGTDTGRTARALAEEAKKVMDERGITE